MNQLSILNVVGCRPNFVKIAPLMAEMARHPEIRSILVHTGQHYDSSMSDVFFQDLGIPGPDFFLNVGSASQASSVAQIGVQLEKVLSEVRPDLVLVVGDVTSTMAATLTSVSLGFPVAHVEAGLRSFDREMPEEINRVVTDALADLLFVTESTAIDNLLREGKNRKQIFFCGNVMIDSLVTNMGKVDQSTALTELGLQPKSYALVTLHRPSNVDTAHSLESIAHALRGLQEHVRIVFPVHPRTAARLEQFQEWDTLLHLPNVRIIDPLGYVDFIKIMKESLLVVTDSGGVQEETTALGVPCLTVRDNTERPVTVTHGTNQLVGTSPEVIIATGIDVLRGGVRNAGCPENWDGRASERIVSILLEQQDHLRKLYRSVRERGICSSNLAPALQYQG
jgi:UDP-N-acetylglucosamine 2-epimerase (non-hydrolysing)